LVGAEQNLKIRFLIIAENLGDQERKLPKNDNQWLVNTDLVFFGAESVGRLCSRELLHGLQ
jgi:hypothetical protein